MKYQVLIVIIYWSFLTKMTYYLNCLYKIKYHFLICLYGNYYTSEKIDKKQIYEDKLNNTSKLKPNYEAIITSVITSEPMPKTDQIPKTDPIPKTILIPMHISKSVPKSKIVYINDDAEYGYFVYLN